MASSLRAPYVVQPHVPAPERQRENEIERDKEIGRENEREQEREI